MKNKTKQVFSLLLIVVLCLTMLAGCTGNNSVSENTSEPLGTSKAADNTGSNTGSIVAYVGTNIFDSSLDPVKGAMSWGYSFTNAALLKVNTESEYVGDMAADWNVSADALTYTFTLRQGVKFSDGSELKASDVVFTYETVKSRQAENENVDLTRLAAVTAEGDYKVVFTLSEPYSPFLDTTAMLGIVPANTYDSTVFDQKPIGSGPWKIVQYDPNQQIIVTPNEHYYEGSAPITRITLVYMDSEAALAAAHSGQLDVVMVSPDYASEQVNGMSMIPLETMDIRNISLPVLPQQITAGIKTGNDVTSDPAVREALAIGIDRKTIIQNAYNGVGKPATGFMGNLNWANADSYQDNREAEAVSLLENAGWLDSNGDGIREKNGIFCEFDVYAVQDRYVLAAALAEDAARLGIKINPHSASWDQISANLNTAGVVWGWGQYSPTVLASLLHSRYVGSGGYDNVVGYQNPEVDALIDRALGANSREAAVTDWQAAQKLANADYPYLYLVNIEHCFFVSDRLDISLDTQIPHPHGHGSPIICNMKDWTLR
ncbi:MAG: ABC transporter substrate-binding protein [Saccharofermentanales bacterium]